jgi:excisionase family DNA binding protein
LATASSTAWSRSVASTSATGTAGPAEDVLTLDEVAELLRVPSEQVRVRAMEGDLPGRRFGDEWRFLRAAVLAWLAGGPSAA